MDMCLDPVCDWQSGTVSSLLQSIDASDSQACRGHEIIHPYPCPYPQIFRGYPWIYPYPQMPIIYRLTYRPMHLMSPKCRRFLLFDIDYRNIDIDTIFGR